MTELTGTIVIRRRAKGWTADFAQASNGPTVRELFGTTELPMPYTPAARRVDVQEALEARNPQCAIVVEFVTC